MYLDTWSVVFGFVIAAALMIIFNRLYFGIFGGKEVRRLKKENRELTKIVAEKDKYIKKSLDELEKHVQEKQDKKEQV